MQDAHQCRLHIVPAVACRAARLGMGRIGRMRVAERHAGLGLAILLLAGGCSPYVYGPEIARFAGATTRLDEAVVAVRADSARTFTSRTWQGLRAGIASGATTVRLHPACGPGAAPDQAVPALPDGERCVILVAQRGPGGAWSEQIFATDPNAVHYARAVAVMQALDDYAAALKALSNADDRKALDAATAQFCTGAGAIAAAAGVAGPVFGAVCGLVGQTLGIGLDHARYRRLRDGVEIAQARVIPSFATVLAETLERAQNNRRALLREETRQNVVTLRAAATVWASSPAAYDARTAALSGAATSLGAIRASNPRAVAQAMAEAHAALAAALADDTRQVEPLTNAVSKFANEVEKLRQAIAGAPS
ncbi:MAG: hypothetical protein K2X74_04895 [Acetobacteraceae bacterium]|nr:hypothetical protein [Acetobacteraceae bacterium]